MSGYIDGRLARTKDKGMSKTQDYGVKLKIVLLKLMRLHSEPNEKLFGASEQLLRSFQESCIPGYFNYAAQSRLFCALTNKK